MHRVRCQAEWHSQLVWLRGVWEFGESINHFRGCKLGFLSLRVLSLSSAQISVVKSLLMLA